MDAATLLHKVFMFLGFVCFLVAALGAGKVFDPGAVLAWFAGGFSAWSLAWVARP